MHSTNAFTRILMTLLSLCQVARLGLWNYHKPNQATPSDTKNSARCGLCSMAHGSLDRSPKWSQFQSQMNLTCRSLRLVVEPRTVWHAWYDEPTQTTPSQAVPSDRFYHSLINLLYMVMKVLYYPSHNSHFLTFFSYFMEYLFFLNTRLEI